MNEPIKTRECRECHGIFPETNFSITYNRVRGRRLVCKRCRQNRANELYSVDSSNRKASALACYYKNTAKVIAQGKKWKIANPEKHKEHQHQTYLRHRESRRQKAHAIYLRDQEKIRQTRKLNKDKQRAYDKKRYAANPKYYYEVNKRRRLKDPEPSRWHASERHKRLRSIPIRDLTRDQWQKRLEEFGYHCAYCWTSNVPLTKDHLIPITKGGHHTLENIVPACRPCNARKGNRSMLEVLKLVS